MANGRRETDKCSTDKALELVCAKAYECVVKAGENTAIIEAAIEKCRGLVGPNKDCTYCENLPPGFECRRCGRLA